AKKSFVERRQEELSDWILRLAHRERRRQASSETDSPGNGAFLLLTVPRERDKQRTPGTISTEQQSQAVVLVRTRLRPRLPQTNLVRRARIPKGWIRVSPRRALKRRWAVVSRELLPHNRHHRRRLMKRRR